MDNRREAVRVDFETRIVVEMTHPAMVLKGDSKNLSLKGLFVETQENIALHTPCHVQVMLSGTMTPRSLSMEGKVVRKAINGVAIEFEIMDIDSYALLKNIVRYNTENPDDI